MGKLIDVDMLKFPNIAIFNVRIHGEDVPVVRLYDLQELMPAVDPVPAPVARLMTLEELKAIYNARDDHVWPFDTPPYVWFEVNPSFRNVTGYFISWSDTMDLLENNHVRYDIGRYGIDWRCWTGHPTSEQKKAEPWNLSLS